MGQHIAISGDLGSGKSTVAALVSAELDYRVVSSGEVQRKIADELGLSTLQVNWMAEQKSTIDARIDGALAELNGDPERLIVDARLGWHFVRDAYKVHLIVDPVVGANRLLAGRYSAVEAYQSVDDAMQAADERAASERRRFIDKYGVDITRLSNYDLVIDTSAASPQDVARAIVDAVSKLQSGNLLIDPRRVYPLGQAIREISDVGGEPTPRAADADGCSFVYVRPYFYLLSGYRRLSNSLRAGDVFVSGPLIAEADDVVAGGLSAIDYVASECKASYLYDWEDAHDFRFTSYPVKP